MDALQNVLVSLSNSIIIESAKNKKCSNFTNGIFKDINNKPYSVEEYERQSKKPPFQSFQKNVIELIENEEVELDLLVFFEDYKNINVKFIEPKTISQKLAIEIVKELCKIDEIEFKVADIVHVSNAPSVFEALTIISQNPNAKIWASDVEFSKELPTIQSSNFGLGTGSSFHDSKYE